jgi:putative flavoprotein involved in K+ transport
MGANYGNPTRINTIVIGGGQAGLSVGYHLARQGVPFLILEAHNRVGDVWRQRWDSLRLFSPARFDGLDGMRFPARSHYFPTKDEMADFLESYARHFQLPVRTGVRVDGLTREDEGFVVTAGDQRFLADNVVIAMASYQKPKTPPFAAELDPSITQMHSMDYRRPDQLKAGGVLLVGAGNSGAEIAMEARRNGHGTIPDPDRLSGCFSPGAYSGHADGPQGPAQADARRDATHSSQTEGPEGGRHTSRPPRHRSEGRPAGVGGRARAGSG